MSNNNTNTQKTTFWKFLTDKTIEIPIIQRDYAQGREGKEHLRKKFLSDLKVALDKGEELKLDFVYGSKENNKLNPLDGQQRLTTLWLLHWYIALRSGRLTDANTTLNKFTYETRISSREFCKELCKTDNFDNYCFGNIVEYIKNQTWFYSAWKQDPTIQSMLRMLGGTKNEKGGPNNDGIEQVFNRSLRRQKLGCRCLHKLRKYQFTVYYHKLTNSNECPIIFYYLPLNEFKLTDDLYIKMNARGEQLTSFENFKADLIGYITKQKDNDKLPKEAKEEWENLLDEKTGIPIKMDTDWTNIFWKNKSQDYKIDEIYFAFLNRFFLNWRISIINDDKDAGYKYLTGDDKGENAIVYKALSDYYYDNKIELDLFVQLKTILNNYYYSEIDESNDILRHDKTWNEKFYFIPKYNEEKATEIEYKNKIYTINQKERVAFYAICKYFNANPVELINGKLDYTSLKRWMRVVWNIISVQTADGRDLIRNVAEMKNAIELIDKIQDPHRVYECLSAFERSDYSDSLLKDQFAEEIAKAKQILDNEKLREYHGSFKYGNWEYIIKDAEKTAFFKGSIRFLFQGSDGSIIYKDNAWDTGMFDRKFANAKLFFGKDKKDKENNKEQYKLLKFFICKCSEDDRLKLIKYDILSASWKNSLLNKDLAATTHLFLIGNISDLNNDISLLKRNIDINKPWDRAKLDLVSTMLLENITYNGEHVDGCRLREYNNQLALFPDNAKSDMKKYVLANIRNAILSELLILKKEQFHCDQKIKNCDFFWGWDIKFQYKDNHFTYFTDDTVCLMNENWVGKKPRDNRNDKEPQNYYYFSVDESENAETFLKKLKCIAEQQADKKEDACFNECDNNPASLQ